MENKNFDGMEQPSWYDGKMIDEVAFCASFLHQHPFYDFPHNIHEGMKNCPYQKELWRN